MTKRSNAFTYVSTPQALEQTHIQISSHLEPILQIFPIFSSALRDLRAVAK